MTRICGWKKTCAVVSGIVATCLFAPFSFASGAGGEIQTIWNASSPSHPLKTWSFSEIQKLKSVSHHEKDPVSGQSSSWKGPEVSLLVDKTIESLPADQKAQVDVIVLKDSTGHSFQLPRALFVRFPAIISLQKSGAKLVLPLSSKPKIWEEGLPLGLFQMRDVTEIEFANSRQLYGSLFLKSRKDPLAVRGEKIYTQNCMSCHSGAAGAAGADSKGPMGFESAARKLASASHPSVKNAPQLKSREMRALISYLDAFHLENPSTSGASFTGK
jgi:mono/diheme cytochrome c family protein